MSSRLGGRFKDHHSMRASSVALWNAIVVTAFVTLLAGVAIIAVDYLIILGGGRLVELAGLLPLSPMLLGEGGHVSNGAASVKVLLGILFAVPALAAVAWRTFRLALMNERLIEGVDDGDGQWPPHVADSVSCHRWRRSAPSRAGSKACVHKRADNRSVQHGSAGPPVVSDDRVAGAQALQQRTPEAPDRAASGPRATEAAVAVIAPAREPPRCRYCGSPLHRTFADLGMHPLSNDFLRPADLACAEATWPLHAFVCDECRLVQLERYRSPEQIFSEYLYFSSCSESWLRHAEIYAASMIDRLGLTAQSRVVEIASNDGYLLQYFVKRGIPALGVEPAANIARVAIGKGVPTRIGFFGRALARDLVVDGQSADLLIGNNVLAHVPDLNDFVAGLYAALKPDGVLTMEFPHLLRLMEETQFDTIYHEHLCYFSFLTVQRIFGTHGLRVFDVERLPTHGGSLRIHACRAESDRPESLAVARLAACERAAGLDDPATYDAFAGRTRRAKRRLLAFLIDLKNDGKSIVGYGAAAKGNTLLNYCGLRGDFLDYVADANPHKQGLFLPGSRIPVVAPERIRETRPDFVLILPWNLKDEIVAQLGYIRDWGGRFLLPVPEPTVIS